MVEMQNPATYQPNPTVLSALQNITLVAIVGPSGSGKTTLVKLATEQDPGLHVVISDVSRPKRPEEQEGVDYFFRDKQSMLEAIERQEYAQVAPSNSGDIYASHVESYTTDGTALITVWADAMPVFRALPFKRLRTVFIVPASYEAWQAHLGLHGFDETLRAKRLSEAERSLRFALEDPEVELLVNDDLAQATIDLLAIVHRPPNEPMPDQSKARQVVQNILDHLVGNAFNITHKGD